jgi:hypothetical protein
MTALTPTALSTRLRSTAELLTEIADETHRTLLQLCPADMRSDHWQNYRTLTNELHENAAKASNLADELRAPLDPHHQDQQ